MCDIIHAFWNKGIQPTLALGGIIWGMSTQIHILKQPSTEGEFTNLHLLGILFCLIPMLLLRVICLLYRTNIYWIKSRTAQRMFENSKRVYVAYGSTNFIWTDVLFGVMFLVAPTERVAGWFHISLPNANLLWLILFLIVWVPLMVLTGLADNCLTRYVWKPPPTPLTLWDDDYNDRVKVTMLGSDTSQRRSFSTVSSYPYSAYSLSLSTGSGTDSGAVHAPVSVAGDGNWSTDAYPATGSYWR